MSYEKQYIKSEALSLALGDTLQTLCPFCDDEKGKLSITRTAEGLLYNCYRASCDGRGFIRTIPADQCENTKVKGFKPKRFEKPTQALNIKWMEFLSAKYGLYEKTILRQGWKSIFTGPSGILMPLYTASEELFGHTTKYFSGSDRKAIHYLRKKVPMLHFAVPVRPSHEGLVVVLVEDVISAAKVQQIGCYGPTGYLGYQGVALLGTDLTEEKVKELLKYKYHNVIIALDPDATEKAVKLRNRFALSFQSCKVAILPADPKDMKTSDLAKILKEV